MKLVLTAFFLLLISLPALSAEYEVVQKDIKFNVNELKVKLGDTVKFINNDPFFHNIFSLSDTQIFDLGTFPQGTFKSIQFTNKGVVEVECAIHPGMQLKITVE